MDSQAKYALLARGAADVYLRLPSRKGYIERIWDHAAGALIASEAGCTITDIHGKPLDFSHGRGLELNAGILGAPPELHARLLAAAREVLSAQ
jgi:3'(2'), 5'-bisphosphate nucleotidase